jgi:hypothetical protein
MVIEMARANSRPILPEKEIIFSSGESPGTDEKD